MAPFPNTSVGLGSPPAPTWRPPTGVRLLPTRGSVPHGRAPALWRALPGCLTSWTMAGQYLDVMHLHYNESMKTATIPAVRVEPEFRTEMEAVLAEGETLSEFVEASVRAGVERRRVQAEFVARGLRARDVARQTDDYVDADVVVDGLQRKLDAARARAVKKAK